MPDTGGRPGNVGHNFVPDLRPRLTVADVHTHPAEPRTLRLALSAHFWRRCRAASIE
ncbi:MAG: hypothetical protein ABI831_02900 [Betaproteobacteria bacterium]